MGSRIEELEEQVRKLKHKFKLADADFYIIYGILVKKGIINPEKFQKHVEEMQVEVEKNEQWLKKCWKKLQKEK